MSRTVYSLLLRLVLPLQVLRFWWRGWRHPIHRGALRAHLSWGLTPRDDRPLWLHAASAGEVQALAGLLQQLRERHPALPLLLTVGTATGLQRARELYGEWLDTEVQCGSARAVPTLVVQPACWDLPGAAERFMSASAPRLGVFVETELWPNLVHAAAVRKVPLLLSSARVSARSTARYLRWAPGLMRETVHAFASIRTQSAADRERFVSLGAEPARVQTDGNLKFDLPVPADVARRGAELHRRLGLHRPVWTAGSTHDGEEAICVAAQRALRADTAAGRAAPLLVLAPRRPERFEAVARWLEAQGIRWKRHSALTDAVTGTVSDDIDVLLVDRFGELLTCHAAAQVCFVGGTLVPVGGHNLLEPAALGKPVLAGPHCFNAPDSARLLAQTGALRQVHDAVELSQALRQWLEDAALAARLGEKAAAAVAANRGAAARSVQAITALLEAPAFPTA
jgi:3-deoxy-D-manno-octulosonic-acid transferase